MKAFDHQPDAEGKLKERDRDCSQRCQGIRSKPSTPSAKSAHEKPRDVRGVRAQPQPHGPGSPVTSGFVEIRGVVEPSRTSVGLAGSVAELGKATPHGLVFLHQRTGRRSAAKVAKDALQLRTQPADRLRR